MSICLKNWLCHNEILINSLVNFESKFLIRRKKRVFVSIFKKNRLLVFVVLDRIEFSISNLINFFFRVIANYMLWSVIDNSLPFLSKEWRYLNLEYFTVITGKREESPRWKKCLSNTLDIALSSYYIRHHFKDETKDEVNEHMH